MQQTIVAIERDGFDVRVLSINLEILKNNLDIRKAVVDACTEFVNTEEGRKMYEHNCNCFNWADFEPYVPNEICEKHGFRKLSSELGNIEVNWDEHLVDDGRLIYDDEDEEE